MVLFLLLLPLQAAADPSGPVTVVDSDTWDVGDTRVRLFGIDAPELDQTCRRDDGSEWDCGRWSAAETDRLYGGRLAECEALHRDRYDRVVARCRVGGRDAAREMVGQGLALAYRRYSMDYDLDEKAAFVARVGIHAGTVERPAEFRAGAARADGSPEGGLRHQGERLGQGGADLPRAGQRDYGRTRISEAKGERWFCSEAEARAAGWRKAMR